MNGIESRMRQVWYAPTAGRHFFSKQAACVGEARARIKLKYPAIRMERNDPTDWMNGDKYWTWERLPHAQNLLRRYARLLMRSMRIKS